MNWDVFVSGLAGGVFGSTLVGVLLKAWIDHRLAMERSTAEEARRLRQRQKEASVAVADILAEWVRPTYLGKDSNEDRWRLQCAYWRGILALDSELLDVLLPALAGAPGASGSNDLIVQARKVLLGLNKPDIAADQLNNWPPLPSEVREDPIISAG